MIKKSPLRLCVEYLEDRLTPTTGIPWPNPGNLTLSFAPNGTQTGNGTTSSLYSMFGSIPQASWETQILEAFQTWAVQANINIGLVSDDGAPIGTNALTQADPQFGDIRVSAQPLTNTTSGTSGTVAQTVGYDPAVGGLSGDLTLNSLSSYMIGMTSAQPTSYDLYSVAVHEAGLALSLAENNDPTTVMWGGYAYRTGLSPSDISAIQALYGARTPDQYAGSSGDGTLATAFNMTANGNLTSLSANLNTIGDTEMYRFTTPSVVTGINGLTVNLNAAGISLLTAQLSVLDANGNVVASTVTTDPTNNNLSITIPNYQPSTTYYVQVKGASSNVFSVGAYNLQLNYSLANGSPATYGQAAVTGSQYVNSQGQDNNTLSTATPLGMANTSSTTFTALGSISTPYDVNWYQITPTAATAYTGTLSVGVVPLSGNGFLPTVSVYNSQGNLLPTVVVTNQDGAFTVELGAQSTGTTYYIEVAAANPTGNSAVGQYALTSNLSTGGMTTFSSLSSGTVTASTTSPSASLDTTYSQLTVNTTRLLQFSLAVSTATGAPQSALQVAILDGNGNIVFSLVAVAGQPLTTGTVWLENGTYTVAFTAATQNGSALQGVNYNLSSQILSNPTDPYIVDMDGPGSPPTSPPPPPPPPILVISDPVSDPVIPTNPASLNPYSNS